MATAKTTTKAPAGGKTSEDNPTSSTATSQQFPGVKAPKASSPFIDSDSARSAYEESWRWYRVYMDPCDEFERIARNRPSPNIDPTLPRITDGTLSGIIQETPKRIIQQIPTGFVVSKDYPEYAPIADVILREKLILSYTNMGSYIHKVWNMLGKSMTYGIATSYTFFTQTDGKMHTDFIIPYVKDSFGEKGKVYQPDSHIRFLRSWYQKRDLQAIISRELNFEKKIKGYKTPYNLKALANWMDSGAQAKPAYLMTPAEKEKGGETGGFELIHAFQKGIDAEFYGFAPRFDKGANIYTKTNKDPRGAMPLDDQYCNIDLSNPLGRGQVELSGGIQNLMDQQMQLYQFIATIMQGPPLQTWGNVNKDTLKYRPNAIWDMGTQASNKVEPVTINNEQITSFVTNMSFLSSKINMINATQDAAAPAGANNTNQSKTQAGVLQQQQRLGASDNYLQQMSEDWIHKQSETSLNLYFANMKGKERIQLGEQDVKDLEATPANKYIKKDKQGNPTLNVDYDQLEAVVFAFRVDPGTSKKIDDQEQLEKLQAALTDIGANGRVMSWYLGQEGKKLNVGDIYRQMFERMGLQNLDTILQDMDEQESQAAKQQPYPLYDMPHLSAAYQDLPPSAQVAFLGGAGIPVNPQEVMQQPVVDPNVRGQAQPTGQQNPDSQIIPNLHPALQTLSAMKIPINDLPPNAQQYVLQLMGLPQGGQTVEQTNAAANALKTAHGVTNDAAKTALQIQKQAHDQGVDIHKTAMNDVSPQQPMPQPGLDNAANPQGPNDPNTALPQSGTVDGQPSSPAPAANDPNAQPPMPQNGGAPTPQMAPTGDVGDIQHFISSLNPKEKQIVQTLVQHGFNDQDIEQAIVMLRQGMPIEQVIQTLGAKHGQAVPANA